MKTIITHANCTDGFAAKYLLMGGMPYDIPTTEWLEAQHGDAPPDVTGRRVIMADFTWPREHMERMLDQCMSMEVYDHHATAKEDLKGLRNHPKMKRLIFDMERSGAGIVYDEFHSVDGERSEWVDLVEDMDLWRFRYDATKPFIAYLRSVPQHIGEWRKVITMMEDPQERDAILGAGRAILRAKDIMVRQSVELAQETILFGEEVRVANVPYFLCSEVAHELVGENRVGVTWFRQADGLFKISFRSNDGRSAREFAEAVAKMPGAKHGGGHGNAAGAGIDYLPWEDVVYRMAWPGA